jgi:hypothetical protein
LIILTTLYPITAPARLAEIRTCFERNAANALVERIVVFAEGVTAGDSPYDFLSHPKVCVVPIRKRPFYGDFFAYAEEFLGGEIVAVCNADVYFDESAEDIGSHLLGGHLWCLSRWNLLADGRLELQGGGSTGSADAWIFRAPLRPFESDILVGVVGCDSYLAQKASDAGIPLDNPCFRVVLRHLHLVGADKNERPDGICYWEKSDYRYFVVRPSA